MSPLDWPEFTMRLGWAVLLGAVVGFERQWHQKMAGLKTNALVSLGAAGFTLLGLAPGQASSSVISAQIVTGIGFLGAGVIMRDGTSVHGLNTAATLWCSAMVGSLAGWGEFWPAGIAAALLLGVNLALRPVANRLNARVMHAHEIESTYTLTATVAPGQASAVRQKLLGAVEKLGMAASRLEATTEAGEGRTILTLRVTSPNGRDGAVETAMAGLRDVLSTSWTVDRATPEA